jgi:peroxiredoxin
VAKEFGVLPAGKANAARTTFIIDKSGTIAKIYPAVKNAGGHPQEILEYVQKTFPKK